MSDLTSIDILINPEDVMLTRAKSVNDRLLASVPSPPGFALDENHQPHITTLQRYVRTADLDGVFDAVQALLRAVDMSTLTLTARRLAVAAMAARGLSRFAAVRGIPKNC